MTTYWTGKAILITGATGILGSWLTSSLLDAGARVVALIRDWDPQSELIRSGTIQQVSVVNGSLEDYGTVERAINKHGVDTVFHLGAQTIVGAALRNPLATFESNIRGTYHLLDTCRAHSNLVQRVVVASSDKAYGLSPVLPYIEEMPLQGRHPYDVSKSCTDLLAVSYFHTYGLPVAVARCGNIYGGGDLNWSRIVPGTIRSLVHKQTPIVRSDGTFVRDYLYVRDAVEGYLLLAEQLDNEEVRGQAFNFSPEAPATVLEVVDRICVAMDMPDVKPIILNQAQAEIRNQYLDSSKARKILGWQPRYSFDKGIRETIEWYRDFLVERGVSPVAIGPKERNTYL